MRFFVVRGKGVENRWKNFQGGINNFICNSENIFHTGSITQMPNKLARCFKMVFNQEFNGY